jgi:hypothetical protein
VGVIETITDEDSGIGAYNPVSHNKEVWDCPRQSVEAIGSDDYDKPGCAVTSTATIGAASAVEFGLSSIPYFGEVSDQVAEATSTMNPGGVDPGEFGLTQFVGELRELRDTVQHSARLWRDLLYPIRKKGAFSSLTASSVSMWHLFRGILQVDLTNKFAYQPLVADLFRLHRSVSELCRVMDKLRSTEPFRVYGRSTRDGNGSFTAVGYPYDYYHWGNSRTYERTVRTWAMVQAAPMSFPEGVFVDSSVKERLQRIRNMGRLLSDFYKVNSAISTAWQLMPFSWVVDYFVDIGSFLDQFDGRAVKRSYTVLSQGYSIKSIQRSVGWIAMDAGTYRKNYQDVKAYPLVTGTLTRSQYSRVASSLPWDTQVLVGPEVRIPNLGQIGTLLELILLARTDGAPQIDPYQNGSTAHSSNRLLR